MNLKQLFLVTAIQIVITYFIFPFIPDFIQKLVHGPDFFDSDISKVYGIIFKWGVINMLIFSMIFVGKQTKHELKFIVFSEIFLAVLFYQKYNSSYLVLTLTFLTIALIIFSLRIPLRKLITKKQILAN